MSHDDIGDDVPPSLHRPRRLPVGSLRLSIAGDLVLVKPPEAEFLGLFRRYEAIFEHLLS